MYQSMFSIIFVFFSFLVFGQTKQTYTYAVKEGEELKLDIYYPESVASTSNLPTLVWMHGGGFVSGNREFGVDVDLCKAFADQGYIAVSISYRLTRKGTKEGVGCDCPSEIKLETFKKASEDYLDAIDYLIRNQEKLKIDSNKIIAGGSSAGAEGILNAVFMKEKWFGNKYENIDFAGLFSCAGAVVDPMDLTSGQLIPGVYFHGAKDNLVPFGTESHHLCGENQPGYFVLNGSRTIVDDYIAHDKSYFLFSSKEGKHEYSAIPFEYLNEIFQFFETTVIQEKYQVREIEVD